MQLGHGDEQIEMQTQTVRQTIIQTDRDRQTDANTRLAHFLLPKSARTIATSPIMTRGWRLRGCDIIKNTVL